MREYPRRDYEVFVVSGTSQNFVRCLESIRKSEPDLAPERLHVFAGWPLAELPEYMWPWFRYHEQERPFAVTRENNRALRMIWGRGRDAVLVEDDVEIVTPGLFRSLSTFASAYDGRCFLSPGIDGYKYDNVVLIPRRDMAVHREPRHFPIICCYFPVELELLVGYYDEGYTSYGCDDNDYSLRLLKAAVPMLACPKLLALHHYDRSVFKARGRNQSRSREYFKAKWGEYPGDPKLD